MTDATDKDYLIIVQCDIVKQRCSGYLCESAFQERTGGFAGYPPGEPARVLAMTCGGCCGRATHRKLGNAIRQIKKREGIDKDRIVVHLSSCITKDNYHGPPCPHLDYLHKLIAKLGVDLREDTVISKKSQRLREDGTYEA